MDYSEDSAYLFFEYSTRKCFCVVFVVIFMCYYFLYLAFWDLNKKIHIMKVKVKRKNK